jgi:hypothetical protein
MSEDRTWTPDKVEALAKELRELIEKHKAIPEQCHAERFSSIHKIGSHIIRLNPHSALTWALERIKEVETERDTYRDMDRQSTERNRELIAERDAANAGAEKAITAITEYVEGIDYRIGGYEERLAKLRALKEAGK